MVLFRPPGVYAPQGDSRLLLESLFGSRIPAHADVLDLCTGTGVIALAAARLGAGSVHAVDSSARAVLAARCNAWWQRAAVHVEHGDFRTCTAGRRYDVVTANPPYVPCPDDAAAGGTAPRGDARAWDAGEDGRRYLDRLCAQVHDLLRPGGFLLLVHSGLVGAATTLDQLRTAGLSAEVTARRVQPFGPVLTARAPWLEERGMIYRGQRYEELVMIRADRPGTSEPVEPLPAGTAADRPGADGRPHSHHSAGHGRRTASAGRGGPGGRGRAGGRPGR